MKPLFSIQTSDGDSLKARFFSEAPKAAVFMVPAMGVSQDFYAPLAEWLSTQGYAVLTFDYRGMGYSENGPLKDLDVDVVTWARIDTVAALEELERRAPGLPIFWLGHSLGGQIYAMTPHHASVQKMITVTSGSGYWLENASSLKWKVWWLWYFVVPFTLPVFGYFPGKRLKMVGDLPAGVMKQWRRWCLNREYAVGVEGESMRNAFASVKTPITSISFTDDELMSEKNIRSLHEFYTNASKKYLRVHPKDFQLKHIGHFGFFREKMKDSFWSRLLLPELK